MSVSYSHIFEQCKISKHVTIDPVKGRDGLWGVAVVAGDHYFFVPRKDDWETFVSGLLSSGASIGVWDVRRIIDWPLSDETVIWDIRSLFGGDQTLPFLTQQLVKKYPGSLYYTYIDLDQKVAAHQRALKTTRIDVPVLQAIPPQLLADWVKARCATIDKLWSHKRQGMDPGELLADYEARWPFIRALREVELNGVHVDLPFVEEKINGDTEPATGSALRSLRGLCKGGFVTSLINPIGSKTGRVRHEGGFNTLGIPHGPARKAITSRYDDGLIYTFDFNAIDYRCIVNSIGGDMAKLYDGAEDFHERTASFIFQQVTPGLRKNVKFLSYIYIYGGQEDTLVQKTGWSRENVKSALALLDKKIAPIKEFRAKLWMQAQEDNFVVTPSGCKVLVSPDDNEGKVVGLYAQTYSTWVFEQAFTKVQKMLRSMKSKVIFEVHDELVIDVHPDEFGSMEDVRKTMQLNGHVVKMKKGPNYGQQD
jgi:hypothetical protein